MRVWLEHREILKTWLERAIDARVPEVFYRKDFYAAADAASPHYLASVIYPEMWDALIEEIWDEWQRA